MIITEWIPLRPPLDTARCEIFPHSGGISQLQAVEPDSTTVFSPHFNHYAGTVGASCRIASASACTSIARAVRPYASRRGDMLWPLTMWRMIRSVGLHATLVLHVH